MLLGESGGRLFGFALVLTGVVAGLFVMPLVAVGWACYNGTILWAFRSGRGPTLGILGESQGVFVLLLASLLY